MQEGGGGSATQVCYEDKKFLFLPNFETKRLEVDLNALSCTSICLFHAKTNRHLFYRQTTNTIKNIFKKLDN